ncbi:unnamed protein product [Cercospora beticola]|nr:unnamed protein product [Cercospora beticola]
MNEFRTFSTSSPMAMLFLKPLSKLYRSSVRHIRSPHLGSGSQSTLAAKSKVREHVSFEYWFTIFYNWTEFDAACRTGSAYCAAAVKYKIQHAANRPLCHTEDQDSNISTQLQRLFGLHGLARCFSLCYHLSVLSYSNFTRTKRGLCSMSDCQRCNLMWQCGVFSLTPQRNERTGCGGREGSSLPMKRDDALKAINAYCDRDLSLDPAFNPGDQFFQEPPDGASWDLFMEGLDGYVIKMDAKFGDGGQQTGCLPGKRFSTKGEECKRKLTNVVDACGEEGGIQFDNTQNGCVMWSIYGSKGAP